jgi:hypothetical protein
MPIVVDEVVITVEVGNAAGGGTTTPPAPADERQALVAECVERVLEILRDREEP